METFQLGALLLTFLLIFGATILGIGYLLCTSVTPLPLEEIHP